VTSDRQSDKEERWIFREKREKNLDRVGGFYKINLNIFLKRVNDFVIKIKIE